MQIGAKGERVALSSAKCERETIRSYRGKFPRVALYSGRPHANRYHCQIVFTDEWHISLIIMMQMPTNVNLLLGCLRFGLFPRQHRLI